MKPANKTNHFFRARKLTLTRIIFALAVAVIADGLQLMLGFFGWIFLDQAIDVMTMVLVSWAIGFHWLLLPTFILEFIPLADELPTWTACVIAVIILRKREQRNLQSSPPDKPIIEI
ncbi:MAG: hypothetical protein ACREFE_16920 [Limisphaerales bacterium]